MPNGYDRLFIRLCRAIDGFKVRYNRWPTRVRVLPASLGYLRDLFTSDDFAQITAKVALLPDEAAGIIAEDDAGASYDYGRESFTGKLPSPCAAEWLGVNPKPHE